MEEKQKKDDNLKEVTVHFILGHSYFVFLLAIILGVFLDTFLKEKILSDIFFQNIGFLMLIISSFIIYWAQSTSFDYRNKTKDSELFSYFESGPYKYLRNPTHLGLFVMSLGFSLMIGSLFSIILTILAHIITRVFFMRMEEKILEKKYGQVYSQYKKKVKNWI